MRACTRRVAFALGLGLACALPGCVNQNTWTPTVDTYNDPNAARLSRDEAECRQLALRSSGGSARNTAKGAALGGLGGAAAGAAIGAAAGNAGMGAAVGAATAGLGAAAYQGLHTNQLFKRNFEQCLRGRGHNVLQSRLAPRSVTGPG